MNVLMVERQNGDLVNSFQLNVGNINCAIRVFKDESLQFSPYSDVLEVYAGVNFHHRARAVKLK